MWTQESPNQRTQLGQLKWKHKLLLIFREKTKMLRKVILNNKDISINQADVLGSGGEAVVVKSGNLALKIYHTPDPKRLQKVSDFIKSNFLLPPSVCAPKDMLYDTKGSPVGFTMLLIPRGYEVVQQLATRSFRNANPTYTTKTISELFINAHDTISKIHNNKIVMGDNNDLNSMCKNRDITFIDVDSFQFGKYPCMVGTENFLPPELYNLDLATKPYFTEEHDWYGFFVMLIRSLILVHPYGGVHNTYRSITQRALAKLTFHHPTVKYPKVAFHPDILNTNLHNLIHRMFGNGERFKFPVDTLKEYAETLVECNSCHMMHPVERSSCPQCATINTQQIQRQVSVVAKPGKRTVNRQEVMSTTGKFIWWKVCGQRVFAISLDHNQYALHICESLQHPTKSISLFAAKGKPKFDLFSDRYLVVNQEPSTDEILILDISSSKPVGYAKRITAEFAGERIFACTPQHLLRIQNGVLFRGEHNHIVNKFVEQNINGVIENQTWFVASPINTLTFGFCRFFNQIQFWLYRFDKLSSGEKFDIPMPLDNGESLLDISVQFSPSAVMCMLKTEIKRKTYTRVYVIHDDGQILSQYRVEAVSSDTHRKIHGKAFAKPPGKLGFILHPTDDGVVQEIIDTNRIGQLNLMSETEQFVSEGDSLLLFRDGIAVVSDQTIDYLTIT